MLMMQNTYFIVASNLALTLDDNRLRGKEYCNKGRPSYAVFKYCAGKGGLSGIVVGV